MKPSTLFFDLCASLGQKNLAQKLGLEESDVSRMKQGTTGIKLTTMDEVFEIGKIIVLSQEEYVLEHYENMSWNRKLEETIRTLSELWNRDRSTNSRVGDTGNVSKILEKHLEKRLEKRLEKKK